MKDLESLPCLTYEQGDQNSFYFSEEILSTLNHEKSIKVTDKGTIIDLMTGTDGYTISSGICPSYLRGDDIISIPLDVEEIIRIGVITHKDYRPTALGQMYLDVLQPRCGRYAERISGFCREKKAFSFCCRHQNKKPFIFAF